MLDFNQFNEIFLIDNGLRAPLLTIANKLLGRQRLNFNQLTSPEQQLWNLFEKSDIYEFLTGEKDTIPEFCHNWLTFSAKPTITIDTSKIAEKLVPIPQHQLLKRERERKGKVDYKALHIGKAIKEDFQNAAQDVKTKCKSMRKSVQKSAKATMT